MRNNIQILEIIFNNIEYGWINVDLLLDKEKLINIDFSYVYNPLNDFIYALDNLKNKQVDEKIEIDEEGPILDIIFKNRNKILEITLERESFKNNKKFKKTTIFVEKEQFIKDFKEKLIIFYESNRKEFNSKNFKFHFNKNKLRKL